MIVFRISCKRYLVVDLNPKTKSVALQLIFVVQRLNDFQRSGPVVVSHHRKLVCAVTAILNYLKIKIINVKKKNVRSFVVFIIFCNRAFYLILELVGLVFVVNRHG